MQFETMARQVGEKLLQQRLCLSTAESCTGGGLAQWITSVDGSSQWFERGFVTYSNLSKQQMLGVSAQLIAKHGAVSEATAIGMAEGAVAHSETQLGVGITGIAGPGGGSEEKPVGTVYLAFHKVGLLTQCDRHLFKGNRIEVREQAIAAAFNGLLKILDA